MTVMVAACFEGLQGLVIFKLTQEHIIALLFVHFSKALGWVDISTPSKGLSRLHINLQAAQYATCGAGMTSSSLLLKAIPGMAANFSDNERLPAATASFTVLESGPGVLRCAAGARTFSQILTNLRNKTAMRQHHNIHVAGQMILLIATHSRLSSNLL